MLPCDAVEGECEAPSSSGPALCPFSRPLPPLMYVLTWSAVVVRALLAGSTKAWEASRRVAATVPMNWSFMLVDGTGLPAHWMWGEGCE